MQCNCCYEVVHVSKMAYCLNCKETGRICHTCISLWGNEHDITTCTVCQRENTMKNLPTNPISIVPFTPSSILLQPQITIQDSFCKCFWRIIFWICIFSGLTYAFTMMCVLIDPDTPVLGEIICISSMFSLVIVVKNRKLITLYIMPRCMKYDHIMYV